MVGQIDYSYSDSQPHYTATVDNNYLTIYEDGKKIQRGIIGYEGGIATEIITEYNTEGEDYGLVSRETISGVYDYSDSDVPVINGVVVNQYTYEDGYYTQHSVLTNTVYTNNIADGKANTTIRESKFNDSGEYEITTISFNQEKDRMVTARTELSFVSLGTDGYKAVQTNIDDMDSKDNNGNPYSYEADVKYYDTNNTMRVWEVSTYDDENNKAEVSQRLCFDANGNLINKSDFEGFTDSNGNQREEKIKYADIGNGNIDDINAYIRDEVGLSASRYFELGYTIAKEDMDMGQRVTMADEYSSTYDAKTKVFVFEYTDSNGVQHISACSASNVQDLLGEVTINRVGFVESYFKPAEDESNQYGYYTLGVENALLPTTFNAGLVFDFEKGVYIDADGMQVRITGYSFKDREFTANEVSISASGVAVDTGAIVKYRVESAAQRAEALRQAGYRDQNHGENDITGLINDRSYTKTVIETSIVGNKTVTVEIEYSGGVKGYLRHRSHEKRIRLKNLVRLKPLQKNTM